jgi:hypothetical protein
MQTLPVSDKVISHRSTSGEGKTIRSQARIQANAAKLRPLVPQSEYTMNISYIIYAVVAIAAVAVFFVIEKRALAEAARYYPRHPNLDRWVKDQAIGESHRKDTT